MTFEIEVYLGEDDKSDSAFRNRALMDVMSAAYFFSEYKDSARNRSGQFAQGDLRNQADFQMTSDGFKFTFSGHCPNEFFDYVNSRYDASFVYV